MLKNVVISGASRGIGKEVFEGFSKTCSVLGTETNPSNTKLYPLDLSDQQSIRTFSDHVHNSFQQLDVLINSAAILIEDWDDPTISANVLEKTLSINLIGTVQLTESLIPLMKEGSHIINISSNWGSFSDPSFTNFQPHYKISKAALNMYTKVLAQKMRPSGIKVHALDPGWVKTDMGGHEAPRSTKEIFEEIQWLIKSPDISSGYFWHRKKTRDW